MDNHLFIFFSIMKSSFILLFISILPFFNFAGYIPVKILNEDKDTLKKSSIIIGGNLSYAVTRTFIAGDIYLGTFYSHSKNKIETNIGYNYHQVQDNHIRFGFINYYSNGFFLETNYIFKSSFYSGLRLSYNINKLTNESKKKLELQNTYTNDQFISVSDGTSASIQTGYLLSLSKHLTLRLQGALGIRYFKIKWLDNGFSENVITENTYKYTGNLTIGIRYQF